MKQKTTYAIIALALVIAISMTGIAQAHVSTTDNNQEDDWHEYMDLMHEQMTQNLDPQTKETVDQMHESCMGD